MAMQIVCRGVRDDDCRRLITFRIVKGAVQVDEVIGRK